MTSRRIRLVSLIVLAVSLSIHVWDLSRPGLVDRTGRLKVPDFLQFYTYGSLIRAGQSSHLYDAHAHAQMAALRVDRRLALTGFHPNYSPVIALLMAPLAVLTFLQAAAVWSAISLLLYGIAVVLLTRTTETLRADPLTIAMLAASWPALFVVLRYGQISALTLACLSAAVWLHKHGHPLGSGVVLGLLAYKPNLLIAPALIVLLAREWRLMSGLLLGTALELSLAVAVAGPRAFAEYVQILIALGKRPDLVQLYSTESHSFRGLIQAVASDNRILAAALVAGVAFATWAGCRIWRNSDDGRVRWSALTLAMLFASPHLLTYDLLLLAVPLILIGDWRSQPDLKARSTYDPREEHATAWRVAMGLLYIGAWPGTLLARMYHVQPSTIGMALVLWLLCVYLRSRASTTVATSSSMSPIISS
jgi:hypothetical protein